MEHQQESSSSRKRKQTQPRKLTVDEKKDLSWNQLPNEQVEPPNFVIDLNADDDAEEMEDDEYTPQREGPKVRQFITIDDDEDFYGPAPPKKKARRKSFPASPAKKQVPIQSDLSKDKRVLLLRSISIDASISKEIKLADSITATVSIEGQILIFEEDEPIGTSQFPGNEEVISSFIYLAKKNMISFSLFITSQKEAFLKLYLTSLAFPWGTTISSDRRETIQEKNMKNVILFLFPKLSEKLPVIVHNSKNSSFEFNPNDIFDEIKPSKTSPESKQPDHLIPTLRPYQKRAVYWMLQREQEVNANSDSLHPLWMEITTEDGKQLYMNPYTGLLSLTRFSDEVNVPGGILSDEMGLGKTLELLSVILLHPAEISNSGGTDDSSSEMEDDMISCVCGITDDVNLDQCIQCDTCHTWHHTACVFAEDSSSDDESYDPEERPRSRKKKKNTFYCEKCTSFAKKENVESKTTLIVCPQSILPQWKKEIEKHVKKGKMKIFVYEGVRRGKLVLPTKLASYDVVLTTFEVLREDLHHFDSGFTKALRAEKKYKSIPTPLSSVRWWRVAIDECQMVESSTANASKMALKLDTVNRWCVSGTPIQRNLDDLFGLIMFLKLSPYDEQIWWNRVLQRPFETGTKQGKSYLLNFLRKILWRSSKKDVADELHLPPQTESVVELTFSPVESYFYKKQFSECQHDFGLLANKKKGKILSNQDFMKLMNPLLRLRQACCHPQVGSKAIRSLQKNTMSMSELLDQLVAKAHVECEESLRSLIFSLNGLAGTLILQDKKEEAIKTYCQVLEVMFKNPDVEADKMQWIHTLFNLQDMMKELKMGEVKVNGETLSLESLYQLEKKNEEFFTKQFSVKVDVLHHELKLKSRSTAPLNNNPWYATAMGLLKDYGKEKQFMKKMRDTFSQIVNEATKLSARKSKFLSIKEFSGVQLVFLKDLDALEKCRKEAIDGVEKLHREPSTEELMKFNECGCWKAILHRKKLCHFCAVEDQLIDYERRLYWSTTENSSRGYAPMGEDFIELGERNEKTEHLTEHPSEIEFLLKIMQGFLKHFNDDSLEESSAQYFNNLDEIKTQFKALKKLFLAEKHLLSNRDELVMTKSRLKLRSPEENVTEIEKNFKVLPFEIPHRQRKFITEKGVAEITLKQAQSQLKYLEKLQQNKGDAEKEICPVCTEEVGPQRVLFVCGHALCEGIIKRSKGRTIKCPTCRTIVNVDELSYIMDSLADENKADVARKMKELYPVKGSYGTKVEGIIRQLLIIEKQEKNSKSLVFSEWADVLEIISRGLSENDIKFTSFKTKKGFQKALDEFKNNPEVRVLLLPIKTGANGLNIIEATNVLLVEPMLNLASEAQAINRVHRIGQQNRTHVYRFMIKNTIEEKILSMNKNKTADWKSKKEEITIEDLESLFTTAIEDLPLDGSQMAQMDTDSDLPNTPALFWNAKVKYHSTVISRLQALGQIELVFSWECKEQGKNIASEKQTIFMGRAFSEEVCRRLLDMEVEGIDHPSVVAAMEEMKKIISKNGKEEE